MTTAQQPLVPAQADSLRAILTDTFEGVTLTCVELKGRPAYIAREIGAALGYADKGAAFADRVTRSWSSELVKGRDYDVLEGEALEAFKALTVGSTASRTRNLLILFERGLHVTLLKTRKPAGVRLRAWLADHAMPALARGKAIDAEGEASTPPAPQATLSTAELRERRLTLRETRLTVDRMVKAGELTGQQGARILREALVVSVRGRFSEAALALLEAGARVGVVPQHRRLPARVPPNAVVPPEEASIIRRDWLSPTEIAEKLQVTGTGRAPAKRVGIAISAIGLANYVDEDGQPDKNGLRKDTRYARPTVVNKRGAGDSIQVDANGNPDPTWGSIYHPDKVPPMVRAWLQEHRPKWLPQPKAAERPVSVKTRMTH